MKFAEMQLLPKEVEPIENGFIINHTYNAAFDGFTIYPKTLTGGERDEVVDERFINVNPEHQSYMRYGATQFLMLIYGLNKEQAKNRANSLIKNNYENEKAICVNNEKRKLSFVDFNVSLDAEPIKEPEFLVDRLIYKNAINLISGDPKTYKTYVAIDIVVSVITGTSVFENHPVNQKGKVLFISPEFDTRGRILKLLKGRWNKIEDIKDMLYIPSRDELEFITWSKDKESIIAAIEEYRPALIVLDPLTYIFDGEITKNEPVTEFFRELKKIIRDYDTTILLTHHNNRMNTENRMNNVSGASAITRYADSIIYLQRFKEDEDQDFFKSDEELDKQNKEIKLIKGVYRHGGEGYKYYKIIFNFMPNETDITAERYSNKEEQGVVVKNIPKAETYALIESEIMAAIKNGKLGIEFTKDNVLSIIENNTGKSDETFKRYVGDILPSMVLKGTIQSIRGKGYTTQIKINQ